MRPKNNSGNFTKMEVRFRDMLAIITLLLISNFSFAQNSSIPEHPSLNDGILRINFLGLAGFSYEKGLGSGFTFRPEAGLGWPLITDEHNEHDELSGFNLEYPFNPYFLVETRYYYNLDKREKEQKSIANFSGNYVGAFYRYSVYQYLTSYATGKQDSVLHNVHYVGMWWGLQRNLGEKRRFYFNFALGPGFETDFKSFNRFNLEANLGLGLQF
ncbi:MAG TPA: hypothetical protein PLD02_10270 [Saprospiraceae bacterium]|nr:hypothetical protein [Saprospiraceae bacterium]